MQTNLEAAECLGISLPFSNETELKRAYRRASFAAHPDHGGSDSEMCAVLAAFRRLRFCLDDRSVCINGSNKTPLTTIDGTPLSELGLGLGPTTNGTDCERCEGRGYREHYGPGFRVCLSCDECGEVPRTFPCRPCNGSGKFTQRRSKRVVDCRACQGTGNFKHPRLRSPCKKCHGTKTIWGKSNEASYNKCSNCDGTGEVRVWNPVLPKGALTLRR